MKKVTQIIIALYLPIFGMGIIHAQPLTLKDAINIALTNYGTIKAKSNYVNASNESVHQSRRDYLPNIVLSAQQDYGTINGQNGPMYGFGGYLVSSSGLPLANQNWNAAFGALYLANINWDFFSFGRAQEKIKVAQAGLVRDKNDLAQEQFQHQIKVAAAYLNVLAAHCITTTQQRNLERAIVFKTNVVIRAKNGLVPGVDSSLANAEVSNAKIALTNAKDMEQEQANKLAVLIGVPATPFVLDTTFISRIPASILNPSGVKEQEHPLLKYYQSRINLSIEQTSYYRKQYYPTLSLFGIIQGRGSGFTAGYTYDQKDYSDNYGTGINPVRGNYLMGVGMNWNLTTIIRNSAQVNAQKYISQGLQNEYDLVNQQLKAQMVLSDTKIKNALDNSIEAPIQVRSASDAYLQKSTLYKNGLATLVDVTQTLYTLNRAESQRDIANSNVWQALLMKAAATGDMNIFMNEF